MMDLQAYVPVDFEPGAIFEIKDDIEARVQNISGDTTEVRQTYSSITSKVADLQGRCSVVELNSQGLDVTGSVTAEALQTATSGPRIVFTGTQFLVYGNGSHPNIVFGMKDGYMQFLYYDHNGNLLYSVGPNKLVNN